MKHRAQAPRPRELARTSIGCIVTSQPPFVNINLACQHKFREKTAYGEWQQAARLVRRRVRLRRLGTRAGPHLSASGLSVVAAAPAAGADLRPVVGHEPLDLAAQGHGGLQVCEDRSQVGHGYPPLESPLRTRRSVQTASQSSLATAALAIGVARQPSPALCPRESTCGGRA